MSESPAPVDDLAPTGVLGDGALRAGKGNMRLVGRAIRENWPIPEAYKKDVVEQMYLVATASPEERNQIAAAKVLIAADAVNARREATDVAENRAAPSTTVNVTIQQEKTEVVQVMGLDKLSLEEVRALRDLRRRICEQTPATSNGNGIGTH